MMKMRVKFSHHARRRAKLYRLSLSAIEDVLRDKNLSVGKHEVVEEMEEQQKFPIKIVVSVEKNTVIVITIYPLKRRKKGDEGLL